jgi:hypothetical protein
MAEISYLQAHQTHLNGWNMYTIWYYVDGSMCNEYIVQPSLKAAQYVWDQLSTRPGVVMKCGRPI